MTGVFLPHIAISFDNSQTSYNSEEKFNSLEADSQKISGTVSALDYLISIGTVTFWNLGDIPIFINIFLLPIRVLFWFIVARTVFGSGG